MFLLKTVIFSEALYLGASVSYLTVIIKLIHEITVKLDLMGNASKAQDEIGSEIFLGLCNRLLS